MAEGVSASHFYMWRAIFAVAHADGQLDADEEAFMDKYLKEIPFSIHQKALLEDDIINPKDPGDMLAQVTDPQDQGMFFEFARMMVWSDGNYDAQEKEIMQRLLGAHMEKLDVASLTKAMQGSREHAGAQMEALGKEKKQGLGAVMGRLLASAKRRLATSDGVSESRFYMWRAIFAMAHADHVVTENEQQFMQEVLDTEPFSQAQRIILERDITNPQNAVEMFISIAEQEDRSRFFYYARMLVWCDGNFDKQEQEIVLALKSLHVRNIDFERMMRNVDMELAAFEKEMMEDDMREDGNVLVKFFRRFRG